MTKEEYLDVTGRNPKNFGGLIFPTDFNTNRRGNKATKGSDIAARILADYRFNAGCKKSNGSYSKYEW